MALPKTPAGSFSARAKLRVIHTPLHAPAVPIWLDLANAEVKKGNRTLQLKPKAFAVLRYLSERAPQLVTKQEFFDVVWADTYVTDGVLKNCIAEIRQALQDSVAKPQYIETVARRGYRFIGKVQDPASAEQPPEPSPIVPSPQSRVGERRQLTVMSCDVAGAPTLTTALDPEDYQALLQTLTSACREVMARYDGYVAPSGGSGLFVYFGYPVAHEDAARRAVQAGMDLLQTVKDLRAKVNAPQQLHVRIGIHTGSVVIEERRIGEQTEHVAVGETLRLATHLQTLAATNTLMISAATQRLVAGYTVCEPVEPPGGTRAPGALPVYRVVETKQTLSRLDVATATGLTPLVVRVVLNRRLQDAEEKYLFERLQKLPKVGQLQLSVPSLSSRTAKWSVRYGSGASRLPRQIGKGSPPSSRSRFTGLSSPNSSRRQSRTSRSSGNS